MSGCVLVKDDRHLPPPPQTTAQLYSTGRHVNFYLGSQPYRSSRRDHTLSSNLTAHFYTSSFVNVLSPINYATIYFAGATASLTFSLRKTLIAKPL